MTTLRLPSPTADVRAPAQAHLYRRSARPGAPVLALFTGSRADYAVAARAADLARGGHPVTAAAVVRSTGFSINALLHHARHRRVQADADAILATVLPAIARAGPVRTTALVVPARANPYRTLPAGRIERAARRLACDVILSPVPLPGRSPHPAARPPARERTGDDQDRSGGLGGRRARGRLPGPATAAAAGPAGAPRGGGRDA
ncbi:hypothetical protein [Streptomyces albogriseolus]|uniref:hypothetical protein n=1 Tax=Streptomyces albogriseolus TaxID=1887 RepID=UPI0036FF2E94